MLDLDMICFGIPWVNLFQFVHGAKNESGAKGIGDLFQTTQGLIRRKRNGVHTSGFLALFLSSLEINSLCFMCSVGFRRRSWEFRVKQA